MYDPAAGTAGFLVAAYNHIRLAHSSPGAISQAGLDGKRHRRGRGDLLSHHEWHALQNATFFGDDVDPKMVRLATMNLTLRGLANVPILQRNVLTTAFDDARVAKQQTALGVAQANFATLLASAFQHHAVHCSEP